MKYSLDYSTGTTDLKTNPGYENKKTITDKIVEKHNAPKQLKFDFKTDDEANKDPNVLRRIKHYTSKYDDIDLGKDYDKAIAEEDKKLANSPILKKNINKKPNYPTRATPGQVGKLAERIEKSRQMTGGPSTWDIMKKAADTPEEKNEIKRILNREYYKNGTKYLDKSDFKFIGKYKEPEYPKIEVPTINENLISRPTLQQEPQIPKSFFILS